MHFYRVICTSITQKLWRVRCHCDVHICKRKISPFVYIHLIEIVGLYFFSSLSLYHSLFAFVPHIPIDGKINSLNKPREYTNSFALSPFPSHLPFQKRFCIDFQRQLQTLLCIYGYRYV